MSDVRQPVQSFNFCFINHPSESEKMERTRNATKKKWWAHRVEQKSKVLSRKKEEIPSQTNGWWSEFGWRKWPSNNNNTPENTVDNTITKSTEDSLRQKKTVYFFERILAIKKSEWKIITDKRIQFDSMTTKNYQNWFNIRFSIHPKINRSLPCM